MNRVANNRGEIMEFIVAFGLNEERGSQPLLLNSVSGNFPRKVRNTRIGT